jgi:nicotinate-nucleotide pyrophosphorylase (carboxylating)
MSGVATTAHRYQSLIADTQCHVLDTRKTTPGLRYLEKEAVLIGGGMNHRIGLFDMILLKDNHVDFAGGITAALTRAKQYCHEKGKDLRIEIETRNEDEIREALATHIPDRIMLDNFTPERTKGAVEIIREWEVENGKHIEIESSGGITIDTLHDYAVTGVDFISIGALTHSIKSLDMSFKAMK